MKAASVAVRRGRPALRSAQQELLEVSDLEARVAKHGSFRESAKTLYLWASNLEDRARARGKNRADPRSNKPRSADGTDVHPLLLYQDICRWLERAAPLQEGAATSFCGRDLAGVLWSMAVVQRHSGGAALGEEELAILKRLAQCVAGPDGGPSALAEQELHPRDASRSVWAISRFVEKELPRRGHYSEQCRGSSPDSGSSLRETLLPLASALLRRAPVFSKFEVGDFASLLHSAAKLGLDVGRPASRRQRVGDSLLAQVLEQKEKCEKLLGNHPLDTAAALQAIWLYVADEEGGAGVGPVLPPPVLLAVATEKGEDHQPSSVATARDTEVSASSEGVFRAGVASSTISRPSRADAATPLARRRALTRQALPAIVDAVSQGLTQFVSPHAAPSVKKTTALRPREAAQIVFYLSRLIEHFSDSDEDEHCSSRLLLQSELGAFTAQMTNFLPEFPLAAMVPADVAQLAYGLGKMGASLSDELLKNFLTVLERQLSGAPTSAPASQRSLSENITRFAYAHVAFARNDGVTLTTEGDHQDLSATAGTSSGVMIDTVRGPDQEPDQHQRYRKSLTRLVDMLVVARTRGNSPTVLNGSLNPTAISTICWVLGKFQLDHPRWWNGVFFSPDLRYGTDFCWQGVSLVCWAAVVLRKFDDLHFWERMAGELTQAARDTELGRRPRPSSQQNVTLALWALAHVVGADTGRGPVCQPAFFEAFHALFPLVQIEKCNRVDVLNLLWACAKLQLLPARDRFAALLNRWQILQRGDLRRGNKGRGASLREIANLVYATSVLGTPEEFPPLSILLQSAGGGAGRANVQEASLLVLSTLFWSASVQNDVEVCRHLFEQCEHRLNAAEEHFSESEQRATVAALHWLKATLREKHRQGHSSTGMSGWSADDLHEEQVDLDRRLSLALQRLTTTSAPALTSNTQTAVVRALRDLLGQEEPIVSEFVLADMPWASWDLALPGRKMLLEVNGPSHYVLSPADDEDVVVASPGPRSWSWERLVRGKPRPPVAALKKPERVIPSLNGASVLKTQHVGALGWRVVSVPWFEWDDQRSQEDRRTYLAEKLRTLLTRELERKGSSPRS